MWVRRDGWRSRRHASQSRWLTAVLQCPKNFLECCTNALPICNSKFAIPIVWDALPPAYQFRAGSRLRSFSRSPRNRLGECFVERLPGSAASGFLHFAFLRWRNPNILISEGSTYWHCIRILCRVTRMFLYLTLRKTRSHRVSSHHAKDCVRMAGIQPQWHRHGEEKSGPPQVIQAFGDVKLVRRTSVHKAGSD